MTTAAAATTVPVAKIYVCKTGLNVFYYLIFKDIFFVKCRYKVVGCSNEIYVF